jgi:two-component system KDP operon response regulator KdpE
MLRNHEISKKPAKWRALVIDDDDVARELLTSLLVKAGGEAFELPSAIGATRTIFQEQIDVVIVDVGLPDISGDKLARLLRENSRGNDIAIVLVSGRPTEELESLAVVARADAVVSKRDVRTKLVDAVNAARERRRRAGRPSAS